MIALSRTAYDDGLGGAHSQHDSNLITFHRFKGFRDLMPKDAPDGLGMRFYNGIAPVNRAVQLSFVKTTFSIQP